MATQVNVINDLGTLTKVPVKILETLTSRLDLCIGSAVHDAIKAGETATILNIGIGTLSINLLDMQCKFIPSKDLKAAIKKSINEGIDPLEFELEEALIQKLLGIYQEDV